MACAGSLWSQDRHLFASGPPQVLHVASHATHSPEVVVLPLTVMLAKVLAGQVSVQVPFNSLAGSVHSRQVVAELQLVQLAPQAAQVPLFAK